jgi:uncharacterized protein YodC (DUF2158 family)
LIVVYCQWYKREWLIVVYCQWYKRVIDCCLLSVI